MGFTPQQARVALAATDSGVDVQAALDTLLNAVSGEDANSGGGDGDARRGQREETEEEAWERREEERMRARRRRNRNGDGEPQPSASSSRRAPPPNPNPNSNQEREEDESGTTVQLDKVLNQASEIGTNLFKTAGAFWSSSKAQLQKAYEERQRAAAAAAAANGGESGSAPVKNGQPRWAQQQQPQHDDEDNQRTPTATGGFKDDDDEAEQSEDPTPSLPRRPQVAIARAAEIDLFSDAPSPTGYKSPHRRRPNGTPKAEPSQSSKPPPSSQPQRRPPRQSSTPTPVAAPKITRQLVSASPSQLSSSKTHRQKGTEMFKLGRYGEAESSYSQALNVLPQGHILRVVLWNNRAAARGKVGDGKGVIDDCSDVLKFIDSPSYSYHPSKEDSIPPLSDGESINLSEAYIKALQRRAQAYESVEKWKLAMGDWEKVLVCDWSAAMRVRGEALRGIGQCKKKAGN